MTATIKHISADDPLVRAIYRATSVIPRYFDVQLHHSGRIPSTGGAMLVGNHALMGVDSWALLPKLFQEVQRVPRGMALRALFDVPGLRRLLRDVGMVRGERASAITLLERGELVLTYPGGARDSLKGRSERYQLKWEGRLGFAHAALAAQAPVIPIAALGPDDCFTLLAERGFMPWERLLSDASLRVPLFVPRVKRVPFDFFVGEPIQPPAAAVDAEARSAQARALADEVRASMEALLTQGLTIHEPRARAAADGRRAPQALARLGARLTW